MRYLPWVKLLGGINLVRRKIRGMLLDSSGDRSWVTDGIVLGYTLGEARDFDATLKTFMACRAPGSRRNSFHASATLRVPSRSWSGRRTTTETCRRRKSRS